MRFNTQIQYLSTALKPRLASNKDLGEMSKKFVMVNVKDGKEPDDKQFRPDGNYVPRILFLGKFVYRLS
jgi:hypothetical protein